MRYLITGGAGFIGSNLTRSLARDGHEVTVFDDFSRGRRERLRDVGCRIIKGDIRDAGTVALAVHGNDAVIHLAYLQGTQTFYAEPRQVLDVAMRGMLNILAACEKTGVGELLLVSSSEAYQVAPEVPTPEDVPLVVPDVLNPRYSYGGGKIACELMALAWMRSGVLDSAVIARPHNIIGPDMGREHVIPEFALRMNRLITDYHHGEILPFPIQGTGLETRSFCWVGDCVSQLRLLLDDAAGGTVWHVGTEDERTIAEVAHQVASCYGRKVKLVPGTLPQGSPPRRLPDTRKIRALGWDARKAVPFTDAVARTVAWYKDHG